MHITVNRRRNSLGELTPPASAGTGASLFDFGSQIVNALTTAYVAKKTGTVPAGSQLAPATVTVSTGPAVNWPRIVMVGSLGLLGVAVAMKVLRKRR